MILRLNNCFFRHKKSGVARKCNHRFTWLSTEDSNIDTINYFAHPNDRSTALFRITSYNVCYTKLLRNYHAFDRRTVFLKHQRTLAVSPVHSDRNNFV